MVIGSKALSNMSEQFSKLNRIGQNFSAKPKFLSKPKFTVGKSPTADKSNTSSESEDDYDVSLYQPRPDLHMHLEDEDQDVVCATDPPKPPDTFLPSVGIVMRTLSNDGGVNENQIILENKENIFGNEASHVNDVQLNSVMENVFIQKGHENERSISPNPEIRISDSTKVQPPSSLHLDRKFSHSSDEVDVNDRKVPQYQFPDTKLTVEGKFTKRSSSEHDIAINLSTSQSESALKQIRSGLNNITSPVASATKDLVLSPFSKLAKGMQNLGANLDPRKMRTGMSGPKQVTERELEELKKLQEKWTGCKTRLIAL